jgi:hypothetical protein
MVRRAQLALGFIVLIVLAVNLALFLIMSEREGKSRDAAPAAATNRVPVNR